MNKLPLLKPDENVRLDGILERQMAVHGNRISHIPIAVFIDPELYDEYGGAALDDDFLSYLCLVASSEDVFTVLSPITHKPIECVCYSYSNLKGERVNDSRKKVVRYILSAHHSPFINHPLAKKNTG